MATTADRLTLTRELGEAVNGQPENVPDALPRLAEMLATETDAEVITEVVVALGFASGHRDHRGVQLILDHVRVDLPDAAGFGSRLLGRCRATSTATRPVEQMAQSFIYSYEIEAEEN